MDVNRDVASISGTVTASCLNNTPTSPLTRKRGRNITMVVIVEAVIAWITSCVPKIAASRLDSPLSLWWNIFSSTTMALSTTIPIVIAMAEREIMFKLPPE